MAEKDPVTTGDGQPTPDPTPTGGGNKPTGTFTQEDLNKLAEKERKRGMDKGVGDLLEALGLENVDSLKTSLGELQKLKDSQLSEQEKLQKALDAANAEKEQALNDAKAEKERATLMLMEAAVIREASKADHNIHETAVPDVWAFVDRELIEVDDKGGFSGIDKAVKAVIEKRPFMVADNKKQQLPGTPRQRSKVNNQDGDGLDKSKRPSRLIRF